MTDIPQPAREPYGPGDRVTVYINSDDADAEHHGKTCVIVDRFTDDLHSETGRDLDQYYYRVKRPGTGEVLPVDFRHRDLVPASND